MAGALDGIQDNLGEISPWMRSLDTLSGRIDEVVIERLVDQDIEFLSLSIDFHEKWFS